MSTNPPSGRRKAGRIGREKLPAALKSFTMVTQSGRMAAVTTYDASTLGLGLIVPLSPDIMRAESTVTLYAADDSFSLDGYVMFTIPDGVGRCRIGIQFGRIHSGVQYEALLKEAH